MKIGDKVAVVKSLSGVASPGDTGIVARIIPNTNALLLGEQTLVLMGDGFHKGIKVIFHTGGGDILEKLEWSSKERQAMMFGKDALG